MTRKIIEKCLNSRISLRVAVRGLSNPLALRSRERHFASTSSSEGDPSERLKALTGLFSFLKEIGFRDKSEEKDEGDIMAWAINAHKTEMEEKLQPPFPMPYISPQSSMLQLAMLRQSGEAKGNQPGLRHTVVGQESHHSTRPLESLSKISLQEMQVRRRHEEKYLLCRTISPASRLFGIMFAVEDPNAWAQIISIHNYPGTQHANEKELETLFPVDSVIAIREPWAKTASSASHTLIHVDSPSDIIFVQEGDKLLANVQWSSGPRPSPILSRSESEWKSVGDSHFQEQEYFASSVAYLRAIKCQPSLTDARLNRSLALMRLELYDAALDELREVLGMVDLPPEVRQRALYLSGQAHYGEGHYKQALEAYRQCLVLNQTYQDAHSGIQLCERRMMEQAKGNFDWNTVLQETLTSGNEADIADFVGPIKVAPLRHRDGGRGVIATRNITAGEVLLVAKPFAVANQRDAKMEPVFASSALTGQISDKSDYLTVIQKCIDKLCMGSDDTARDFYTLYAGDKGPYSDALLRTKEARNTFARDIDHARVEAVCMLNGFGLQQDFGDIQTETHNDFGQGCALYILPSYFNHACLSNAHRTFFGSTLVIRASRSVPEGAEITLSYYSNDQSYHQRRQILSKRFPECDCSLCNQDRAAGSNNLSKRESLIMKLKIFELDINDLCSLVQQIDATYAASHGSFRPDLTRAHLQVASHFETTYEYTCNTHLLKSSIRHHILALKACEINVIDASIEGKNTRKEPLPIAKTRVPDNYHLCTLLCLILFRAFSTLCDEARAEKWLRAAIWIESAATGCDFRILKLRHAELLETFDEQASSLLRKIESSL